MEFDQYAGTHAWTCRYCDITGCATLKGDAKISVMEHTARVHPVVFREVMGDDPTEEVIRRSRYEIMEGLPHVRAHDAG